MKPANKLEQCGLVPATVTALKIFITLSHKMSRYHPLTTGCLIERMDTTF